MPQDRKRRIRELLGEVRHQVESPAKCAVEVTINLCDLGCSKKNQAS